MGKVLIGNIKGPQGSAGAGVTPPKIITVTSSTVLDGSETTVLVNGLDVVVTLPNASQFGSTPVTIKLVKPFTTATVVTSHSQVMDAGFSSYPLETFEQFVTFQSDGHNWQLVGAKSGGDLQIPFTNLPDGIIDQPYSIKLTATGGWPNYTWALKSGSLPQGLSMTPDGVISGSLNTSETGSFTVQVTDSVGSTASAAVSITGNQPTSGAGITLVNRGTVVQSQESLITPVFGSDTLEGSLLLVHIASNHGPIATTAPGWTVLGGSNGRAALAYKYNCSAAETAPDFTGGSSTIMFAYAEEWANVVADADPLDQNIFEAGDGGPSWIASFPSADAHPNELLVGTGWWNGSNLGGTVSLTNFRDSIGNTLDVPLIQDHDIYGQYFAGVAGVLGSTGSFTNQIGMSLDVFAGGDGIMATFKSANAGPPGPPSITTTSPLEAGNTLQPYSVQLRAASGVPPYVWSLHSGSNPLPTGLNLLSTGVISGTPTQAETVSITVDVADVFDQVGTATLSLTVNQTPTLTLDTTLAQGQQTYATVSGITGGTRPILVNNNVWNPVPGWASHLQAVDPTDWWTVANFPAGNTSVSAYPSLGVWFDEKPLANFSKIVSSYDEEMHPNAGSQCWAAYDLWFNNWANEVMIQHDLARFNLWQNTSLVKGVQFGGHNGAEVRLWDLNLYGAAEYVWHPSNNSWNAQSGTIDILEILQWMMDNGYLPQNSNATAFGYGWEICSTGAQDQFFKINSFSLEADHT